MIRRTVLNTGCHRFQYRRPRPEQCQNDAETGSIKGDAFRRDHVFILALFIFPDTVAGGPDTVRVPETDDAITGDHGDNSIGTFATLVHCAHSGKDLVLGGVQLTQFLQFVGEHVQQNFRIRVGVDMAQIGSEQIAAQLIGIGQVPVVRQGNAVGTVHIERLGLR